MCALYCLSCGYDLQGSAHSAVCPECGAKIIRAGQPPKGEPARRSSWWRLWLPLAEPVRLLWFARADCAAQRGTGRSFPMVMAAVILMGIAGQMSARRVRQVEWVFASTVRVA